MAKKVLTRASNTEICKACSGVGSYEQKYREITPTGDRELSLGLVACFNCKGQGVLPLGYQAEYERAMAAFWCSGEGRCEGADAGAFHNDGECRVCDKHHWHCSVCGKIQQVG